MASKEYTYFHVSLTFYKMEPLSVAVHALVKLAGLRADQTVAVFGAGTSRA